MRPTGLVLVALSTIVGLARPAGAQAPEEERSELEPSDTLGGSPRHLFGRALGAWLEAGFSGAGRGPQRADFVSSFELGARFRPDRGVYVASGFGFTAAATSIQGQVTVSGEPVEFAGTPTRLEPGNPRVEVGYSGAITDDLRLELGVGASVPTASRAQVGSDAAGLLERAASEVSLRSAMSMRGYWSLWAWAPERFGLFVPVRLAGRSGSILFEGELALGVLVPVLGDRGADPDMIVQLGAGVGGRVAGPLHLGVRVRGVGAASGVTLPGVDASGAAASEAVVFSAEPWVRLRADPIQITVRGVLSLNGADGVGGDRSPPFGVFVGVGGAVD